MDIKIPNSKITQIESKLWAIQNHFGGLDPKLQEELNELVQLVAEERDRQREIREVIFMIANRI